MYNNIAEFGFDEELISIGQLKFELLSKGIRISEKIEKKNNSSGDIIRTRSGASGGLNIVLPREIYVNVPVNESFATGTNLILDLQDDKFMVFRDDNPLAEIKIQSLPEYYNYSTGNGIPLSMIGQMCSNDRFCYGMTGAYCRFWKADLRCKYCSIGLNNKQDASGKTIDNFIEALSYAVEDPLIPAKHILIGGGTPMSEDMGAVLASDLCRAVKDNFDLSCYVMISAPLDNKYIDMLKNSGADELGMNIEFYSDDAWKRFIPGKKQYIGKKRYFEALEYAVSIFGPINTRSLLIVGLEDPEYSIAGVEFLASLGVMPILSPFRPLNGTELENETGFDYLMNWDIYIEALKVTSSYGIPIGPTCISCQNNVLALPIPNAGYRHY